MGNLEETVKKYKKSLWILKKEFDKLTKRFEDSKSEVLSLKGENSTLTKL